jgi:hypothetical protein
MKITISELNIQNHLTIHLKTKQYDTIVGHSLLTKSN